jgi:hypothetical protein
MRFKVWGFVLCVLTAAAAAPVGCATSVTNAGAGGSGGSGGDATTTATTTGTGGSGGELVDAGPDVHTGPCVMAADCADFSDSCNTGACVNGVCSKLAANEFGACDDGIGCTENDTCQMGKCTGGSLKYCPSTDTCSLGLCDMATDACIQVPGNDGASCNDMDACTLPGTCSGGTCQPGGPVDCTFLDGTCSQGFCDPALGCLVMPLADGASCDDNLFCTVNDVCKAGACGGVPNTCAAPGDVCMIGTCNEAMKSCVAVPGNDGAACNDNNLCTSGEKCAAGKCLGGVPANNGMACDDGNACTGGTTCTNGTCANPQSQILQCLNGDGCCPAGCAGNDGDCLVCHAIVGPPGMGWACPTGATQFCVPPPLDPTSQAQAKAACDACYGLSCFEENADCAGPGYGPHPAGQYVGGDAYFGWTSGCSGDEGRVWAISSSFTTYGYWGK